MNKPVVECCIVDLVPLSPDRSNVRVAVTSNPSFRGFTSCFLTFEVAANAVESAVRERVAWKVKQETGLAYSPDELTLLDVAQPEPVADPVLAEPAPVAAIDAVEEAADPAPDVVEEPGKPDSKPAGQRKRRGKK